ncbi:MAG: acyltransferase [Desulfobacterales bacterium]|nr:MAG: acyltransferase [Desulfobacterales bacterium]
MELPHPPELRKPARQYDNDWLTVAAMLTIFFFHCARFFNFEDWHVKNNQLDQGMTLFVAIVAQWVMPLFFILSGISSFYSLESRTTVRYIGNRFRRLVIPLTFGTFILLIPVQVWIERVSHGQFDGSLIEFYPHYFEGLYAFGGNFAWMGLHLWYLEMLFIFTLLIFPLFALLTKERIQERVSRTAGFFAKKGAIFLFGIPLFLMEMLVNLQPEGVGTRGFGGWSPFSYLVFFVTGFLLALDSRYRETMERSRFIALALGLLTTGLMFFFPVNTAPLGYFVSYSLTVFCRSFNSWVWLVALLGFGSRYFNFNNEILKYAREAVLPFYILHQTVIVTIGFYMIDWEMGIMVKYLLLSTLSFVVIIGIYDLLIRRFNALRFLFGMKVKN